MMIIFFISYFVSIYLITLHGLPTVTTFDGISFVTTDPAPIVMLSPIVTPGRIVTLPPIYTLLPIVTGPAHSFLVFLTSKQFYLPNVDWIFLRMALSAIFWS